MHKSGPGGCAAWKGRFKGCGYKMTAAREAVLDVLSTAKEHLSAEDIYVKVHAKYPAAGLNTVYRTLELLVRLRLVSRFDFGDGRARYEPAEGEKGWSHHHHLVCTLCNRVVDYADFIDRETRLFQETEKGLSKKYGFRITGHQIQFNGVCGKCGNAAEKGGDPHG